MAQGIRSAGCWPTPLDARAEREQAVAAAWSAPGVTGVDDRIVIEY